MIHDKQLEDHNNRLRSHFDLMTLNVVPDGEQFYYDTEYWGYDENNVFMPRSHAYPPHTEPLYFYHTRQSDTERLFYRGPNAK